MSRLGSALVRVIPAAVLVQSVWAQGGSNVITSCPETPITSDAVLGSSFVAARSPCIVFGADNTSLSLNGFTIDMRDFPGSPSTVEAIAIHTDGRSDLVIQGPGTILTYHQSGDFFGPGGTGAVWVSGGNVIDIRQVDVRNLDFTGSCAPLAGRVGTGIFVAGGSRIRITNSLVECYARGIWVINGNATSGISGTLQANTVRENRSTAAGLTFGIFLDGSSRWFIRQNVLTANGNSGSPSQSALQLGTLQGASAASDNQVSGNSSDNNQGTGIRVFDFAFSPFVSTGNLIAGNHATGNLAVDLADSSNNGNNQWLRNNICNTQEGLVPPGVCNPEESQTALMTLLPLR